MTAKSAYRLAFCITAVSFLLIVLGLKHVLEVQGSGGVRGVGFVFGGAMIGVIAAGCVRYYRQRS